LRTEHILLFLFFLQNIIDMKAIFKKIITEYQELLPELKVFNRNINIDPSANYVFVGARRAGKSYFMYQIAQQLVAGGTPLESLLFVNFEDERLMEMHVQHFDALLEAYKEMYTHKPVCFFDEIQNISGWDKFVRRLSDQGYRVYVTGSNANMLSNEIATVLGGRFLVKEIYTLNFTEFLRFHGITLQNNYEYKEQRFEIKNLFEQYFYFGAFPETIKFVHKKEYLSNIYQKVFHGDIVTRYTIKNDFALKLLIKKIAESTTDETSFNRLKHIIKSVGTDVGTATLIDYFGYLEESYLVFNIPNYNAKLVERESKKKFYFNDNGILSLFLMNPEAQLTETLVFNYLRRQNGKNVYYYRTGYEIDFYIPNRELIQVAYSLSKLETREREIRALNKASEELQINKKTILCYSCEEETLQNDISIIPLWHWCLMQDALNE